MNRDGWMQGGGRGKGRDGWKEDFEGKKRRKKEGREEEEEEGKI